MERVPATERAGTEGRAKTVAAELVPPLARRTLALQRSAGNRSVAGWLSTRALSGATGRLQRHVDILPGPDVPAPPERLDLAALAALVIGQGRADEVKHRALLELDAANRAFVSREQLMTELMRLSADLPGPSVRDIALVTAAHTEQIRASEGRFDEGSDLGRMLRGIFTASSFAGKLDERGEFTGKASQIEETRERTRMFLEFAGNLPRRGTIPLYRTIKLPAELHGGEEFPHPLPFSATLSLGFARSWADSAEHVILEFDVPENHPAIALAQLGGLTQVVPKNQGQLEVTVAPAVLRVVGRGDDVQGRRRYKAELRPVASQALAAKFAQAIESARQREAVAPIATTLDNEPAVRERFGSADADAIIRLGPQLEARKREGSEVPERERTFTTKDGKRWVLYSWDDFFGYTFAAYA